MTIETLLDYLVAENKIIIFTDEYILHTTEILYHDFACNIEEDMWNLTVSKVEPVIIDGVASLAVYVF